MRSLWFGVLVCAAMFVACGDDDSDFATRPSDGLSSVTPKSSDSETSVSSSSTKSSSSSEYTRVPCDVETDENCFKDDRNGQTYRTVQIGSQVWMAENLNYETDFSSCYKNVESNCAKYGRLYRWAAAVGKSESECGYGKICSLPSGNIQGVCPSGWHLPDTTEWYALFSAVGGQRVAGTKLKSTSGWYSSGNGTDAFSFSALPAGYRGGSYGIYNNVTYNAEFWSSTEHDSDRACKVSLDYDIDIAYLYCSNKDNEYSVRCLKDYDDESSSSVTPKSSSSSSSTKSSSSSVKSSSSVTQQSSSSETSVSSSSTESSSSSAKVDGSEYDAIANTLKDLRDGQTYKTVKIGDQVWMAENLNFETDSSFCYNDSVEYCEKYGRLYTWAVAMDSAGAWTTNGKDCGYGEDCSPTYPVRGVCPEGWHLPSMDEWDTLFTAAGDSSVAWTKLKSTSGWYNGGNGTDDLGFSVFPAGERFRIDGDYYYEGYNAFFWSSTEFVSYTAFYRYLHYSSDYVLLDYESKNFGFSVRCLQD